MPNGDFWLSFMFFVTKILKYVEIKTSYDADTLRIFFTRPKKVEISLIFNFFLAIFSVLFNILRAAGYSFEGSHFYGPGPLGRHVGGPSPMQQGAAYDKQMNMSTMNSLNTPWTLMGQISSL